MNLLIDAWIPIQQTGVQEKITLEQLLCDGKEVDLCLPRDDMELACLQLLVAITQVLFTPKDKKALGQRYKQPMQKETYLQACEGIYDWFDLNHPETPFMQFRGVKSSAPTPMDKLMAGVADGTNKTFINPQGLADGVCGGCAAIALFNTANNCPSMGGGFKASLRGSTPITVMIAGPTLRETLWLNVLTEDSIQQEMPWYEERKEQSPNYVEGIKAAANINASQIGLVQGLLWQPAHFELCPLDVSVKCSCCGVVSDCYTGFNKEKFSYIIQGVWPHPLSARTFVVAKGEKEYKFPSFTTTQPTWVHLAKLVCTLDKKTEGYEAAPVVKQAKGLNIKRLELIVGGYRNNQATVLERRHELFSLSDGWQDKSVLVDQLIAQAQEYKKALRKALYIFGVGIKDRFAGAGVNLTNQYDVIFYQQTESLIHDALATLHFSNPDNDLKQLYSQLKKIVLSLYEQATAPYQQEPKMLKALAASRRLLSNKYLKDLENSQGGSHE
ncbi:type I-E CRISPR-associated protein Cse1/CasA [Neptunomonas phycophila]|uniref:type I-E CRISPR-associated protein Cse1/CasA n=1 Tax=Neptunomonas phycophila TaxID=1572645 RepID=UPI0015BEEB06|nr:type I-E CRISPR-associated protein Cse1/CasA [Neptunomonas phycophila]QLE96559.1 type I-E CRISPR-associated protein Cse1/CasA [Neptunomonas phycophila]